MISEFSVFDTSNSEGVRAGERLPLAIRSTGVDNSKLYLDPSFMMAEASPTGGVFCL